MSGLMRRVWIVPLLLAGAMATTGGWQPTATSISASTPLGTLTTIQVPVSNLGQPATTAQVYEALAEPELAEVSPAAGPLRVSLPASAGPIAPELLAAFASAPLPRATCSFTWPTRPT